MNELKRFEVDGARFAFPERPTVVEMLTYRSIAGTTPGGFLVGAWYGIRPMIREWESEILPDHMTDLETLSDWAVMDVVTAAVLAVQAHMKNEGREKNSLPPSSPT